VLLGTHPDAKLLVAQHAAEALGRRLYVLGVDALPSRSAEIETLARLWQRESALLPLALYVDTQTDGTAPGAASALDRFVSRAVQSQSVIFAGSREPLARLGCEFFSVDIARPTPVEQAREWAAALTALEQDERPDAGEPVGRTVQREYIRHTSACERN